MKKGVLSIAELSGKPENLEGVLNASKASNLENKLVAKIADSVQKLNKLVVDVKVSSRRAQALNYY